MCEHFTYKEDSLGELVLSCLGIKRRSSDLVVSTLTYRSFLVAPTVDLLKVIILTGLCVLLTGISKTVLDDSPYTAYDSALSPILNLDFRCSLSDFSRALIQLLFAWNILFLP